MSSRHTSAPPPGGLDHRVAPTDLRHDLEVGLEVEQRREGTAHEGLVVGEQQPDHAGGGPPPGCRGRPGGEVAPAAGDALAHAAQAVALRAVTAVVRVTAMPAGPSSMTTDRACASSCDVGDRLAQHPGQRRPSVSATEPLDGQWVMPASARAPGCGGELGLGAARSPPTRSPSASACGCGGTRIDSSSSLARAGQSQ